LSTPINPILDAAPSAVEMFYCSRCGHVYPILAIKAQSIKQAPICPLDSLPLKRLEEAENDPELRK
jgi:uncharacterized protein YbaR (Trm112 family)